MLGDLVQLLKAQNFTGVGSAVFGEHLPQGQALPAIYCEQLNTDHHNVLEGGSGAESADIDIVAVAGSPGAAETLGKLVKDFIRDYSGSMGTLTCLAVLLQDEYPRKQPQPDGGPLRYSYFLTVMIQYQ